MDWTQAKRETLLKLELYKQMPDWTDNEILEQYRLLLQRLQDDDIKSMDVRLKCFNMADEFERFSLQYSSLFNMACRRENPVSVETVQQILAVANSTKKGVIPEANGRGIVMDLAESKRREKL